jgi:signal transduction histidine kinase
MTKRVIEEHGGKIEFASVEGQGSEVTISLPLAAGDEAKRTDADPGEEQTWRSS